jgi:hypothetical protein
LWNHILNKLMMGGHSGLERWKPVLDQILRYGTLSQRILRALNGSSSREDIVRVYKELSTCLAKNHFFNP